MKTHYYSEANFITILIKTLANPKSGYNIRIVDDKTGEKYLKNGWIKEKGNDLINATKLNINDIVVNN